VPLSAASLPRYLFTGRAFQVLRHLPNFARLYWRLFRDGRVPILPKALLVLTLVYVISPLDIVPDFVPVTGDMDDVVVVLTSLRRQRDQWLEVGTVYRHDCSTCRLRRALERHRAMYAVDHTCRRQRSALIRRQSSPIRPKDGSIGSIGNYKHGQGLRW
jgi:uncharacterized membrane protein YkvA (DUF1232 family)